VNVFNRFITIILWLLLMLLCAVIAVFPIQCLTFAQQALGVAIIYLQNLEGAQLWLYLAARLGLLVAGVVIFGGLLWGELRPARPKTLRVQTQNGSRAEVTTDSVARRLAWQIDQLADVISVTPLITAHGRAVDVTLDLRTAPEVDVPMKTDEVVNCAREVIVERMGLQPGKIQVRITHAPYSEEA
jgi:hypothetical protein